VTPATDGTYYIHCADGTSLAIIKLMPIKKLKMLSQKCFSMMEPHTPRSKELRQTLMIRRDTGDCLYDENMQQ